MVNWLTKSFANGSGKPLPDHFFARKTLSVVVDLLGKVLVMPEPYFGEDPASHSSICQSITQNKVCLIF
jgi:3-methyladenine DNA glycosylase Mpg